MKEPENTTDQDRRIALDARDWIVRLSSGNVSDPELQRFKAWQEISPAHRRAFERERAFWQQLQLLDGKAADARTPEIRMRRNGIGRRALLWGGGAAAVAAVGVVAFPRLQIWWAADFSTAAGEQATIPLPDGSTAILNTDSAIAVDFTPELRLVTLFRGEADFIVNRDRSPLFRVAALGGNSDTSGTRFSVKAIDNMATITALEGEVIVAGPVAPTDLDDHIPGRVELVANEQTSYLAGETPLPASLVEPELVLAWRDGRVIFEGKPFSAAMAELGRYLPERIVLGPAAQTNVPVSAIFSTRNAFDAVQALARTQGLVARRIPGVMIVLT